MVRLHTRPSPWTKHNVNMEKLSGCQFYQYPSFVKALGLLAFSPQISFTNNRLCLGGLLCLSNGREYCQPKVASYRGGPRWPGPDEVGGCMLTLAVYMMTTSETNSLVS
ncbi:hypothetical protein EVAR_6934_1 [Eumeta japonica]|uniref:Uncharacterized protein n=1 Tax=Eumeta variegata TaxID=151549 RepID=A0A4C1TJX2_EUMVA|nr:hypothetical protein EVAR_6934_1 [Eumeta japonica]